MASLTASPPRYRGVGLVAACCALCASASAAESGRAGGAQATDPGNGSSFRRLTTVEPDNFHWVRGLRYSDGRESDGAGGSISSDGSKTTLLFEVPAEGRDTYCPGGQIPALRLFLAHDRDGNDCSEERTKVSVSYEHQSNTAFGTVAVTGDKIEEDATQVDNFSPDWRSGPYWIIKPGTELTAGGDETCKVQQECDPCWDTQPAKYLFLVSDCTPDTTNLTMPYSGAQVPNDAVLGIYDVGGSDQVPPNVVSSITFEDEDENKDSISGTVTWHVHLATDTTMVEFYELYIASAADGTDSVLIGQTNVGVQTHPITTRARGNDDHFFIRAKNDFGSAVDILAMPFYDDRPERPDVGVSDVAFEDTTRVADYIGGPVTWNPPGDESGIARYDIYLAKSSAGLDEVKLGEAQLDDLYQYEIAPRAWDGTYGYVLVYPYNRNGRSTVPAAFVEIVDIDTDTPVADTVLSATFEDTGTSAGFIEGDITVHMPAGWCNPALPAGSCVLQIYLANDRQGTCAQVPILEEALTPATAAVVTATTFTEELFEATLPSTQLTLGAGSPCEDYPARFLVFSISNEFGGVALSDLPADATVAIYDRGTPAPDTAAIIRSISFEDSNDIGGVLTGEVVWDISNETDTTDVRNYLVYLAEDGASTGDQLLQSVQVGTDGLSLVDQERGSMDWLVVVAENDDGVSTTVARARLYDLSTSVPLEGVTGTFTDVDPEPDVIEGDVVWSTPSDEAYIQSYTLYYAADAAGVDTTLIGTYPIGTNSYTVASTAVAEDKTFILIFSTNSVGMQGTPAVIELTDFRQNVPPGDIGIFVSDIQWSDTNNVYSDVGGTISFTQPDNGDWCTSNGWDLGDCKIRVYMATTREGYGGCGTTPTDKMLATPLPGGFGTGVTQSVFQSDDVPTNSWEIATSAASLTIDWGDCTREAQYLMIVLENQYSCPGTGDPPCYPFSFSQLPDTAVIRIYDDGYSGAPPSNLVGTIAVVDTATQAGEVGGTVSWRQADDSDANMVLEWIVALSNQNKDEDIPLGTVSTSTMSLDFAPVQRGNRQYISIIAKNNDGESDPTYGLAADSTGERPSVSATNVAFDDESSETLAVAGTISWSPPTDEVLVFSYAIYFAEDAAGQGREKIGEVDGGTHSYDLAKRTISVDWEYICVYTVNDIGEQLTPACTVFDDKWTIGSGTNDPPYLVVSGTTWDDTNGGDGFIGGVISWTNPSEDLFEEQCPIADDCHLRVYLANRLSGAGCDGGAETQRAVKCKVPLIIGGIDTGGHSDMDLIPFDIAKADPSCTIAEVGDGTGIAQDQTLALGCDNSLLGRYLIPVWERGSTNIHIPLREELYTTEGAWRPVYDRVDAGGAAPPEVIDEITFVDTSDAFGTITGELLWNVPYDADTTKVQHYDVYLASSADGPNGISLGRFEVGEHSVTISSQARAQNDYIRIEIINEYGTTVASRLFYDNSNQAPTGQVSDLEFQDTVDAAGEVDGTVTWSPPADEAAYTTYELYIAVDELGTDRTPVGSVPVGTHSFLLSTLTESKDVLLVYTSNNGLEASNPAVQIRIDLQPTEAPTESPTEAPTEAPTESPTEAPTESPTEAPTEAPTESPTEAPTESPTEAPTESPTEAPTEAPTETPTEAPAEATTVAPAESPVQAPADTTTDATTAAPTQETADTTTDATTAAPTQETPDSTTDAPTAAPTQETADSTTEATTAAPTEETADTTTDAPTAAPTHPTAAPTQETADTTTDAPTAAPTQETADSTTEATTAAPTQETADTTTDAPTAAPTEETADSTTEATTAAPTQETADTTTEAPTAAPTQETADTTDPATDAPTEAPPQETADTTTEAPGAAPTETTTEAATEPPTESPAEAPVGTTTEIQKQPATASPTEPLPTTTATAVAGAGAGVYAYVTIGVDSDSALGALAVTVSWVRSTDAQAMEFDNFSVYSASGLPAGLRRLSAAGVPPDATRMATAPGDAASVDISAGSRGSHSYMLVYGASGSSSTYLGGAKLLDENPFPPREIATVSGMPAGHNSLGMTYDADTLEILSIDGTGGLAAWNADHAGEEIEVGDVILEVNGQREPSDIDAALQDVEGGLASLTSFAVSRPASVTDVAFTDNDTQPGMLGGLISWSSPADLGTVEGYRAYLSPDEVGSQLTLIGEVPWSANAVGIVDVVSSSNMYIIVKPYNGHGPSDRSAALRVFDNAGGEPSEGVTNVTFQDTDDRYRYVSGVVTWTPPADKLSEITYYAVYFGNAAGSEQQVGEDRPVGTNFVDVPATALQTDSTYLIVYAANPLGRKATYQIFQDWTTEVPLGSVSEVAFSDEGLALGFIGGPITWIPPTYFADVTAYEVYLADGPVGDIDVTREKVGDDVPVGTNVAILPTNTPLDNWEYVQVMTKGLNGVQRGCYEDLVDTSYELGGLPIPQSDDIGHILNADSFQISIRVTPTSESTFAFPMHFGTMPAQSSDVGIAVVPGDVSMFGDDPPAGATADNSVWIAMADGAQLRAGFLSGWPDIEEGVPTDFKLFCSKIVGARECSVIVNGIGYGPLKFRQVTGDIYNSGGGSFGSGFFGTLRGLTLCDGGLVRASVAIVDLALPVAVVGSLSFVDTDPRAGSLTGDLSWVPADAPAGRRLVVGANDPPVLRYAVFYAQASASGAQGPESGLYEFVGSVPFGTDRMSISGQAYPSGADRLVVFTANAAGHAAVGAAVAFEDIASPLSSVTGLAIELLTTSDFAEVTWTPPADVSDVSHFDVYLSASSTGEAKTLLDSVAVDAVSYIIKDVPSAEYSFVLLYTVNDYGSGPPSAVELFADTGSPPSVNVTSLTFTDEDSDGGTISGVLSWNPPDAVGTVSSYMVYLAASESPGGEDVWLEEVEVGTNAVRLGADLAETFMYLSVYTANAHGKQDVPVSCQIYDWSSDMSSHAVSNVFVDDVNEDPGVLEGTITWELPPYYADIDTWEIYLVEDGSATEPTLVASVPSDSTEYTLPSALPVGPNQYIQIYGKNTNGELVDTYSSAAIEEPATTATASATMALPAIPYSRIEFYDTDTSSDLISGVVTVAVAGSDASDAESYIAYWGQLPNFTIYWGSSPTSPAEVLASLGEASGDLQLTVQLNATTLPFADTYLLAYTMATDGTGEVLSSSVLVVDRVRLPPSAAGSVEFADADPDEGEIGGTVEIFPAENADVDPTRYAVYLDGEQLCSVPAAEDPLVCFIPADTAVPPAGASLTVVSFNDDAQGLQDVTQLVVDLVSTASGPPLSFLDTDTLDGAVGGVVSMPNSSLASAGETHYYLYWGTEGCNQTEFLGTVYLNDPPSAADLGLCGPFSDPTTLGCIVPDGSAPPEGADAILAYVAANVGQPVAIPASSADGIILPRDVVSLECSMVRLFDTVALPEGWTVALEDTDANYHYIGGTATVAGPATETREYSLYLGDDATWFGSPVSVFDAAAANVIAGLPVTIPQGTPASKATRLYLVTELGALATPLASTAIEDQALYTTFGSGLVLHSSDGGLTNDALSAQLEQMECDIADALAVDCAQVDISGIDAANSPTEATLGYTVAAEGSDEALRLETLLAEMNVLQGAAPDTTGARRLAVTAEEALASLTAALRATLGALVVLQVMPSEVVYTPVELGSAMPFYSESEGGMLPTTDTRTASSEWIIAGAVALIGTALIGAFALRCAALLARRRKARRENGEQHEEHEEQLRNALGPESPDVALLDQLEQPEGNGGKNGNGSGHAPVAGNGSPKPEAGEPAEDQDSQQQPGNGSPPAQATGRRRASDRSSDRRPPERGGENGQSPDRFLVDEYAAPEEGSPRDGDWEMPSQDLGTLGPGHQEEPEGASEGGGAMSNWSVMDDEEVESTNDVPRLVSRLSEDNLGADLDDAGSQVSGWTVHSDALMDPSGVGGSAIGGVRMGNLSGEDDTVKRRGSLDHDSAFALWLVARQGQGQPSGQGFEFHPPTRTSL